MYIKKKQGENLTYKEISLLSEPREIKITPRERKETIDSIEGLKKENKIIKENKNQKKFARLGVAAVSGVIKIPTLDVEKPNSKYIKEFLSYWKKDSLQVIDTSLVDNNFMSKFYH